MIPLGISILRDNVPNERMGSAIALVSASLGVGGALGLPFCAWITEHFNWHALLGCVSHCGLASLPHISVAGAVKTGTHGSGAI
ncbi:MFS transporter [Pseudarthrobacter sp. fls2-241-R2A-127]|uniref:MFS transporter n=1 Tax=Pseudarthrobacter sp. fls2-241-R2A-127 TaxID=3040303 RepID=UPI002554C89D|nr:MFS transporter [Pseudarthrobacter sp. fls2-241-R2A-127]